MSAHQSRLLRARSTAGRSLRATATLTIVAALLCATSARVAHAGINVWTSNGPGGRISRTLVIDPLNPSTLYAVTGNTDAGLGGLSKSTDSAASWHDANNGLPTNFSGPVAVDPVSSTTLYAGMNNANVPGAGVFKSIDGATSWTEANNSFPSGDFVTTLAIDPLTSNTVYAGTYGDGLFKSTDGALSWRAVNLRFVFCEVPELPCPPSDQTPFSIAAVVIDPLTPGTLYVGMHAGFPTGKVFKSSDAGSSWEQMDDGLNSAYVTTLAIDPVTPTTLYAGAAFGHVALFKSSDGARSWSALDNGPSSDVVVNAVVVDRGNPSTLYTATTSGVFKST